MNPIEKKLSELSPGYKPHNAQRHAIRTTEDPQAVADSIDEKINEYRQLATREFGPDVFEVEDYLALISLYTPGTINDEVSTRDRLFNPAITQQRYFELGVRSATDLRSEDEIVLVAIYRSILGREPDAEGLAWWLARRDEGTSWDQLVPLFISGVQEGDSVQ